MFLSISSAIKKDLDLRNVSKKIGALIQDASKEEINNSLDKFKIEDIEQYLRNKKLKNLSK